MKTAKQSPRLENDILYWYYQNTWVLYLTINLENDEGPVDIKPEDSIVLTFKRTFDSDVVFKEYIYQNIEDNTIAIIMDEETSREFKPGEYVFGINYYGDGITTLVSKNSAIVERSTVSWV